MCGRRNELSPSPAANGNNKKGDALPFFQDGRSFSAVGKEGRVFFRLQFFFLFFVPDADSSPPPQNAGNTYTHRIVTPVYEITGDCPEVSSLVDKGKAEALLESIDQAQELPDDVREFLRIAAARHYVLHFDRIAEYYAHAPAHIQRLMEDSCLVIIDFNKAIEQGYIRMSERLAALADMDEQGVPENEADE